MDHGAAVRKYGLMEIERSTISMENRGTVGSLNCLQHQKNARSGASFIEALKDLADGIHPSHITRCPGDA